MNKYYFKIHYTESRISKNEGGVINNMDLLKIIPRKALNKAYLKVKPNRSSITVFKTNLVDLIDKINESESEEFHKNLISRFLTETYYGKNHFINTKGRNDLVIHNGKDAKSSVGVIIEAKSPVNKTEMLKVDNINTKAFQELVLYYLRERITGNNLAIKYLIVTNIYEWFIFDAGLFEKHFANNKTIVQQFNDFEAGRLSGTTTDFFYSEIAKPAISNIKDEITFTYFNITEYEKQLKNADNYDQNAQKYIQNELPSPEGRSIKPTCGNENALVHNKLIELYKLLSPEHLLKLPFTNDSNTLDKTFYTELLHIIGLIEVKDGSKKLIQRKKEGQRDSASLIENAISQLKDLDKLSRLKNPQKFGTTHDERYFNVALDLVISWINRILFLKLLEAQQITYHKGNKAFSFLNLDKIENYDDLNCLFFSVLAKRVEDRNDEVKDVFANVPYLNSSLFEPTELEQDMLFISNLRDERKLPIISSTVLKKQSGKKAKGELNTIEYLFSFLDAYDFASESSENITKEDNKPLINASVLGLIFEKINGYKDGSFFTPGFITMYMCRETIRRAVVQKFNEQNAWDCKEFDELYDKIDDKKAANEIINSLKICDPAVGSGHFLVSALNEIIAIKSELKILLDRDGKTLRDYNVEVVNDELIVTDEDGHFFEYTPGNKERQRIQEALFHEKQTIIENCLFGVDINHNSVKICRLRLWIELLKNAYYKTGNHNDINNRNALVHGELETLPNIDINIKCGDSLISRFSLDADLKQALKKSKWTIDSYRRAVQCYREASTKEEKHGMEKLINTVKSDFRSEIHSNDPKLKKLRKSEGELYNLINQGELFEFSPKEQKARKKQREKLVAEIEKLKTQVEEIKNNKIYENAFEWRFEFPEVLNNDGDFIGFDVIIGNPPYLQIQKFAGQQMQKGWEDQGYKTFAKTGDIYCLFYEKGHQILRNNAYLCFITSNKWMRANYGKATRKFFAENVNIKQLIDIGDSPIFEEATTYTNILIFNKHKQSSLPQVWDVNSIYRPNVSLEDLLTESNISIPIFSDETFIILPSEQAKIKNKIEAKGIQLKDWDVSIYRGVLTGYNEAFIIDGVKKDELIAKDPKNAKIIKPILRGRDIKKYSANFADLWIIFIPWHFPLHNDETITGNSLVAEQAFRKEYPDIFKHLLQYQDELSGRNQSETGIRYEWYALQRCAATYHQEFEKEKIIWAEIVYDSAFYYDDQGTYPEATAFIMTGESLKYITALLNSKLLTYAFRIFYAGGDLRGNTFRYKKVFLEHLPIPKLSAPDRKPFENIVNKILEAKKSDPNSDTSTLESQIDQLVYKLYNLTEKEIAIIESSQKNTKPKPKTNEALDRLLNQQPSYFSFDMLKSQLESESAKVANSTLKTYMSKLVANEKVFDAGKGWYSNLEKAFKLELTPLKKVVKILRNAFPLLDLSCWSTEQINSFTHHMLGKHILFIYVDTDAVNSVHEILLDNGYNSYANPKKPEIEKSFRLLEKTVIVRPSVAKQPDNINGTAPIEKILIDLLFENSRLNIMLSEEATQVVQNAVKIGRINISAMISYAKQREIKLANKNQLFPEK